MKKTMFWMTIAIIAMTSCSSDETLNTNNGRSIGFRTAVDTRATEIVTADLKEFDVTAYYTIGNDNDIAKYFTDVKFTKKEGTGETTFASSPAYYWPGDDKELTFIAFSPIGLEVGKGITKEAMELKDFSPAAAIKDQKDVIWASARGKKSTHENNNVPLTFAHALSQIEVKAKNTNTNYVYKVKGVRIGYVISKGSLKFEEGPETALGCNWELAENTKENHTSYEVNYDSEKTLSGDAISIMETENENAMILPQALTAWTHAIGEDKVDGSYLAVKVCIKTKDDNMVYPAAEGYAWAAIPIGTTWESGKKYTYTLDFSEGAGYVDPTISDPGVNQPFRPGELIFGKPITFSETVTTWETETGIDVPMK